MCVLSKSLCQIIGLSGAGRQYSTASVRGAHYDVYRSGVRGCLTFPPGAVPIYCGERYFLTKEAIYFMPEPGKSDRWNSLLETLGVPVNEPKPAEPAAEAPA